MGSLRSIPFNSSHAHMPWQFTELLKQHGGASLAWHMKDTVTVRGTRVTLRFGVGPEVVHGQVDDLLE